MRCSNPECRQLTSGPRNDERKAINIGVAAHIRAASPQGPRYDVSMSRDQRAAAENGLWLCQNCAKLIDNDPERFSDSVLRAWKQDAEKAARRQIEDRRAAPFEAGAALGRLFNVPGSPQHFLPRPGDLQPLILAVLTGTARRVAVTGAGRVGMHGMGGIGKTVLAAALGSDVTVRSAFPDGVYWLTVGQKPDLLGLQNKLVAQLTGSRRSRTTVQDAKDELREALERRRALIILDDVWSAEAADAFCVDSETARFVITTRDSDVMIGVGAVERRIGVLSVDDALAMLADWVNALDVQSLPPEAASIASECGYLPLALASIGAMIRQRPTAWADVLARLRRYDLDRFRRAFPGYLYPDLLRAIEISIDALEKRDRERYRDLAIFPKGQPIPERALRAFWGLDELDTRDLMARLSGRSLAAMSDADDGDAITLHDLQCDAIRKRRERSMPSLHLRLANAWGMLPDRSDAYAWRWLSFHLVAAGRHAELQRLLLDIEYIEAKLLVSGAIALISDFDYVDDEDTWLVQSAIRLSAHVLIEDPSQLASQITGRLLDASSEPVRAFVQRVAEHHASPWLQPRTASLTRPGGAVLRILHGHREPVRALCMLPDQRRFVSGSNDGTVIVWDLADCRALQTFKMQHGIRSIAAFPDCDRLLIGGIRGQLAVWDIASARIVQQERHREEIHCVSVTSDGRLGISSGSDRIVRVSNVRSGRHVEWKVEHGSEGSDAHQNVIAIPSPDGRFVISGDVTGFIGIWDAARGKLVRTLQARGDRITALAVTPDGTRIISASRAWIHVWDAKSGELVRVLTDGGFVASVAVLSDERRILSGSSDGTLRIWGLEDGELQRTFQADAGFLQCVIVTRDMSHAVSGSDYGMLHVWDIGGRDALRVAEGHAGAVSAIGITTDGRQVVSGAADKTIRVWTLATGRLERTFANEKFWAVALAIVPEKPRAIIGHPDDAALRIIDLRDGRIVRVLPGHGGSIFALAIAEDARHLVSTSVDQTLRLWDLSSRRAPLVLEHASEWFRSAAITADGQRIAAACDDRTVHVWDAGEPDATYMLAGHQGRVMSVAISPDGTRAVSGDEAGHLIVWDLVTGLEYCRLEGHQSSVNTVMMMRNGRQIVSCAMDHTVRLWNSGDSRAVAVFTGEGVLECCAVSRDERTIVAGESTGRIHFLRLAGIEARTERNRAI
jgi:WD40 repeat protein